MSSSPQLNRRHFTRRLALGVGGFVIAESSIPHDGVCEETSNQEKPVKAEATPEKKDATGDSSPDLPPVELLMLTYLVRRYPSDQFNEESLHLIFRDVRGDVARGRQLSEFLLKNEDEPGVVFSAYRQPE